ncbi:MAG: chorismate mutase [Methanoregula sp.]|nr:chorismate mutase [Methanoregula sp.]
MQDIKQLRKRVDEVDQQILLALSKRAQICRDIGAAKKEQRLPVKDPLRESEVFKHVKQKAEELALNPLKVEAVYREIVNMCSNVQE